MDDYDEEKRTQQILFIASGKSEAQLTNNRRFRSTNCIRATDRHEASRGFSATAGRATCIDKFDCLVLSKTVKVSIISGINLTSCIFRIIAVTDFTCWF